MARTWATFGLLLLGCGPAVQLPSGGGADDGSGGHEAGSTGERTTGAGEDTDTHTPPDSEGDDGAISSGSSSTGEEACGCGNQRLNETRRITSHMAEAFVQASVTHSAIWTREEWAEGGGIVTRHGHDDSLTQWHDQAFSLHAPARMVASDAGAAFGEYVLLDEVWRLQLFDDQGSRVCYLDYEAPLFPTLPPPGQWAFLQPGLAATLLPASCEVDQAETLSLAAVPTDLDILDAVWTSEFLVVLGSRETETGPTPVAVTLDRIDGSLRATTDIPAPSVGHRWSPSNEGILLTLRDEETVEALAFEPATGVLTLLGQVDGAGVTEAIALPHPTDPWLLLDGDDPRVVRLSEDPCCPPMALELYATTLGLHTARRIDDALMLVRDYDDGNRMLSEETFALE